MDGANLLSAALLSAHRGNINRQRNMAMPEHIENNDRGNSDEKQLKSIQMGFYAPRQLSVCLEERAGGKGNAESRCLLYSTPFVQSM